jgi:hypothetical protein
MLAMVLALTLQIEKPAILTREEWGAKPPVLARKWHVPEYITIHHTGTATRAEISTAQKIRNLQAFSQREDKLADGRTKPAWPDVPYHYYIGTDGVIAEGREEPFAGDTNTEYNPAGHLLVVLEGNFESEQPTPAQLESMRKMVLWLAHRWRIPAERIKSHKDYAKTDCPGKALYEKLPELRKLVKGLKPL